MECVCVRVHYHRTAAMRAQLLAFFFNAYPTPLSLLFNNKKIRLWRRDKKNLSSKLGFSWDLGLLFICRVQRFAQLAWEEKRRKQANIKTLLFSFRNNSRKRQETERERKKGVFNLWVSRHLDEFTVRNVFFPWQRVKTPFFFKSHSLANKFFTLSLSLSLSLSLCNWNLENKKRNNFTPTECEKKEEKEKERPSFFFFLNNRTFCANGKTALFWKGGGESCHNPLVRNLLNVIDWRTSVAC